MPAVVWSEMEAFARLLEARDEAAAASLLLNLDPFLDRRSFGRYLESQHRRLLGLVALQLKSQIEPNLGILIQSRGDYGAALAHYERSLKIKEELGDRGGVATSHGQMENYSPN